MINITILFFITLSALMVIYIKHQNRNMNIDIEKVEKKLSFQLNDHKRLLDARAKILDKKLIDINIEKSLGMEIPYKQKIIYLNIVE